MKKQNRKTAVRKLVRRKPAVTVKIGKRAWKTLKEITSSKRIQESLRQSAAQLAEELDRNGEVQVSLTTPTHWDCECKENYIHPHSQTRCRKCGAKRDDQPDARVNEVPLNYYRVEAFRYYVKRVTYLVAATDETGARTIVDYGEPLPITRRAPVIIAEGDYELQDVEPQVIESIEQIDAVGSIELKAAGYEWTCPLCELPNHEIQIPKMGEQVKCGKCGHAFDVDGADHAEA